MSTARNLSKSFFPIELEQGGLIPALGDLAHRTEQQTQVRCKLHVDEDFWIEKDSAIHLYRIVQESIGNAIKHAQASLIRIECRVKADLRTVLISYNGLGLASSRAQARWSTGMGMHLFQYRARLLGATLVVGLPSSGRGCQVSCSLPFAKPPWPLKKA
jgi:signal transduction histidine kinase